MNLARGFGAALVLTMFTASCGGTAPDDAVGAAGSTNALCVGDLDKVTNEWWQPCPATLCAAQAWAQGYCSSRDIHTAVSACGAIRGITVDWGTHGKVCYYEDDGGSSETHLVGAKAWDDTARYCNATSFQITAGNAPQVCAATEGATLCNSDSATNSDSGGAAGAENGAGGASCLGR